MESITAFGATVAASTLALTGLEPLLWAVTGLIAVCIGLLARDALQARLPERAPLSRHGRLAADGPATLDHCRHPA